MFITLLVRDYLVLPPLHLPNRLLPIVIFLLPPMRGNTSNRTVWWRSAFRNLFNWRHPSFRSFILSCSAPRNLVYTFSKKFLNLWLIAVYRFLIKVPLQRTMYVPPAVVCGRPSTSIRRYGYVNRAREWKVQSQGNSFSGVVMSAAALEQQQMGNKRTLTQFHKLLCSLLWRYNQVKVLFTTTTTAGRPSSTALVIGSIHPSGGAEESFI